jgi:transcriptional regulator with XRE-family HTH domain
MLLYFCQPLFYNSNKRDIYGFFKQFELRSQSKKIRQAYIGKMVGTFGDIIGKYEREENTPSVEVASKIANALV